MLRKCGKDQTSGNNGNKDKQHSRENYMQNKREKFVLLFT